MAIRSGAPIETEQQSELHNLKANIRVLEERTAILQKKTELIENNLLKNFKELRSEAKIMQAEITELSRGLAEITEKTKQLIAELGSYAKKEDVDVLKKYLEYWEPMNFVTHREAENIAKDILKKSKV